MNPPSPFWLVWRENGGAPRVQHATQARAENEAQRLAEQHLGSRFIVLAPVARFSVQRVTVERFDPELEIPF